MYFCQDQKSVSILYMFGAKSKLRGLVQADQKHVFLDKTTTNDKEYLWLEVIQFNFFDI